MPDHPPDRVPRRQELEAPYRHPFRLAGGHAWRTIPTLRSETLVATALIVGGGIGAAAIDVILLLTVAVGLLLAVFVALTWSFFTVSGGLMLTRAWREESDLRDALERRPHAGAEDPDLVHDRFAVTVEDEGWLCTWRMRPLRFDEQSGEDEIEVLGRPRHAASVAAQSPFDVADAARAAEQLVAAQDDAAAREAAAADAARRGAVDAENRATLSEEARSTAAALRHAAGQRPPRG
jgi:hypothetical protein